MSVGKRAGEALNFYFCNNMNFFKLLVLGTLKIFGGMAPPLSVLNFLEILCHWFTLNCIPFQKDSSRIQNILLEHFYY